MKTLTEVNRGYFGRGDGLAINRHSFRDYKLEGLKRVTFTLDKNLDVFPPYYEIQVSFDGVNGLLSTIPHEIPDGTTWHRALPLAAAAINKYAKENLL